MSKKIKLDNVFSKYIRLKHSTNGYCKCYTCEVFRPWQDMQNGHFVDRGNNAVRFEEDNCRPQCQSCNEFKRGNIDIFRERLIEDIGEPRVLELESFKGVPYKMYDSEYAALIRLYTHKLKQLESRL